MSNPLPTNNVQPVSRLCCYQLDRRTLQRLYFRDWHNLACTSRERGLVLESKARDEVSASRERLGDSGSRTRKGPVAYASLENGRLVYELAEVSGRENAAR
jgi:hypothetical protein